MRSLSRWVSWRARITIFSVFIVWFIMDHFSIRFMFFEGVVALLMFKVAMFMFAFFLWVFMLMLLFRGPGMGWSRAGLSALWLGTRGATGGGVSARPVALLGMGGASEG